MSSFDKIINMCQCLQDKKVVFHHFTFFQSGMTPKLSEILCIALEKWGWRLYESGFNWLLKTVSVLLFSYLVTFLNLIWVKLSVFGHPIDWLIDCNNSRQSWKLLTTQFLVLYQFRTKKFISVSFCFKSQNGLC